MRLRHRASFAAALIFGAATILSAAPAEAASSPGTITVTNVGGFATVSSGTVFGGIGETFTLTFSTAGGGYIENGPVNGVGTGTVSVSGTSCLGGVIACQRNTDGSLTVTITAYGAVRVSGWASPTTLNLAAPASSGSAGSTAPALVASQPPSVTATPGNGVVQLSIAPGTGGTGTAKLYGIKYRATSSCVAGRTLAPRPTDVCGSCPVARALVPRPNVDSLIACPSGSASVAAGVSGSATTTIPGLENGREYSFSVAEMTTDQLWSGATTVTSTPTAAATCSTMSIDVAQPGGTDAATVTSPVSGTASPAVYPFIAPPYGGTVKQLAMGAWTSASATGAAGGEVATFTPTTDAPCPILVTVPEGAKLASSTGGAWSGGSQSMTVYGGSPVYVFGTKTGTYDIGFSAGASAALKVTPKVRIGTVPQAAYNIAVTPVTQTLNASALGTTKVSVTDVFGNPVAGAKVAVTATGAVLLAGYSTSQEVTTGADGSQEATLLAGSAAGQGSVTAAAPTGSTAWAWQTGYTKPTGAADPVKATASAITVSAAASAKTITISGQRGTADVSLSSGETCRGYAEGPSAQVLPVGCVEVTGVATGFAEGASMTPEYRFPGQTSYTQGIDVTINADGEFTWYRKTGKKIYVRFVNGDVVSDRVIIPAK